MNNLPLVSVIIPNYNHAKYLKERIDSVINQTYKQFELIILDDRSSDDSSDVIEGYRANSCVRYIVYNEENSGSTFKQWEKGFQLAGGELIWIAESDDVASLDFLETMVGAISIDENVGIAFSNSYIIDSKSQIINSDWDKDDSSMDVVTRYDGILFAREKMLYHNRIYNASSVVFKKKLLQNVGNEYQLYKASGDYIFWLECLSKGDIVWVHRKLNYFRQHNDKVSPKAANSGMHYVERMSQLPFEFKILELGIYFRYAVIGRVLIEVIIDKHISKEVKSEIIKKYIKRYPLGFLCMVPAILDIMYRKIKNR